MTDTIEIPDHSMAGRKGMPRYPGAFGFELPKITVPSMPHHNIPEETLEQYLSNKRYLLEIGGVVWRDFVIKTDRHSQNSLMMEYLSIIDGYRKGHEWWKVGLSEFISLDNQDFKELYYFVKSHIQKCFDTEAIVLNKIKEGLITTKAEIDSEFDWSN